MLRDFEMLGVRSVEQFAGQDPRRMCERAKTSQLAKLFAVGHGLELVALPSEPPRCPFASTHLYSLLLRLLSTPNSPKPANPSPQATRPTPKCCMDRLRALFAKVCADLLTSRRTC